jgi:putative ABC transport system permease protein
MVHLFSRPGALDHVQKLTPSAGAGVWFPNVFADKLGVRPGDTVRTQGGQSLRVAGIYRDLAPSPFQLSNLPRYWCTWSSQIVPTAATDAAIAATPINSRQGPWLITDPATVARASEQPIDVSWYSPLPASASLGDYADAQDRAVVAADAISARLTVSASPGTHLPDKIVIARHARDGISGSIVPIDIAGVVVALLLVAGAGVFWATHRAREVRLLVARGVGPVPLGVKAVLETIVPALLGLVGGYAAAIGLVRAVGPSEVFEPGAALDGLLTSVAAVVLGLLLVGVIGAFSGRDRVHGVVAGAGCGSCRGSWPCWRSRSGWAY